MNIINPATEEIIAQVKEDSAASIARKFEWLSEGQAAWSAVILDKRIECLRRFHDLLEEQQDDLAKTLTLEMGKPLRQSYNELQGARSRILYFVNHSAKYLTEEWVLEKGSTKEKIDYEPLGVIANISAWNYPYLVGINVFVPALIAGNGVMYKPSEYATLTGMHISRLLYLAGIPEKSFQCVVGGASVGEHILDLPFNGYFFTGSYKTGNHVAQRIASKLVPCQLELGGKDPMYIMDDVRNIDRVAEAALEGVVYNNGQSCCAVERLYVHANIFESFVDSFVQQAKKMTIGDPLNNHTDIGPLSRPGQREFLMTQIQDAQHKGAKLLTGGNPWGQKGYFIEPTVLINVNHQMNLMKLESFGPVIGIQQVMSDQEAVELMRDTEYGLTAAVFSDSYERALPVLKKINTGTVYWNCCDRVSPALPWSGRKHSGIGITLSYQGIRAFVQPKAYHLRTPLP